MPGTGHHITTRRLARIAAGLALAVAVGGCVPADPPPGPNGVAPRERVPGWQEQHDPLLRRPGDGTYVRNDGQASPHRREATRAVGGSPVPDSRQPVPTTPRR